MYRKRAWVRCQLVVFRGPWPRLFLLPSCRPRPPYMKCILSRLWELDIRYFHSADWVCWWRLCHNGPLSWFSSKAVTWCTHNTKYINIIINDFKIYLVFLQHFENRRFQTTAQTLRHNMACIVTSPPCSRTSSPADLLALLPVKL
jgi:hypothetical protein